MNSEELEQSLREEFESYLGNVLSQVRQNAAEFQSRIESEFQKHQAQIDESFRGFAEHFDSKVQLDTGFRESVSEHLKLARDEGARLAATAYTEAEKMDVPAAQAGAGMSELRDAINDICSQDSQSAILKSLVEHSARFASRGAFFIIKNEHFAGWKVFGDDSGTGDTAIREIHFPTSADSIMSRAASSRNAVEGKFGEYAADQAFLVPLQYGQPERMCAIPLVARERAVAVLYCDGGDGQGPVDREALETLVKVAGLTVELRAAVQPAEPEAPKEEKRTVPEAVVPDAGFAFNENASYQGFPPAANEYSVEAEPEEIPHFEDAGVEERSFVPAEPELEPAPEPEYEVASEAIVYDSPEPVEPEPQVVERPRFERAVEPFEPAGTIGGGISRSIEPAIRDAAPAAVSQTRLSDRPVDLPIEVPEEERRLHNDARRFARLLVSEIKLYNEKKVLEGRQAHDLYDRLKEAIDRSREMYDKRVQPPVAARFDYFHYELVNALAEGDPARFGAGYPGAAV